MVWKLKPQIKVTVNDAEEEIQQLGLATDIYLIENAVSRLHFTATNSEGRSYLRKLRSHDTINAYLRYSDRDWTQVFSGVIEKLAPTTSPTQGYTLQTVAYGHGRAIRNTHCSVDYGIESENSDIDTPSDIISDLITNRINKNFDGGNTGYSILDGNILTMDDPSIQFIKGGYRKNIDILNEIMLMYQAYRDGAAGIHWMVSPTKYLHIDQIGNHTKNPTEWPTYWRRSQELSLVQQKRDIMSAQFFEDATNYANKIVLFTDIRKPASDFWTEDAPLGGAAMWAHTDLEDVTNNNAAGEFVVGSHSLKIDPDGMDFGKAYFPACALTADAAAAQKEVTVANVSFFRVGDTVTLWDDTPDEETGVIASINGSTLTLVDNLTSAYTTAQNANCLKHLDWDLTKMGSMLNPPTINFYCWKKDISAAFTFLILGTYDDGLLNDYFWLDFFNWGLFSSPTEPDEQWIHKSVPVGPYWRSSQESRSQRVGKTGDADWTNIDYICVSIGNASADGYFLLDDLHFTGKIIREAYNSTHITDHNEVQKTVRMDMAVNDSLRQNDATGTAARLAYAELLSLLHIPLRGQICLPIMPDVLPGQLIAVQYDNKPNGTYGIDEDFRIQQVHHIFGGKPCTELMITNDLVNTFAVGPSEALSALAKAMFYDPEAKSLKTTGIDTLVERLSVDYA